MIAHAQPVARGGQPEDIANAVAYLASEESSFMTGTHLLVDGGLTLGQRHAWDPDVPGLFAALVTVDDEDGASQWPNSPRRPGCRCSRWSAQRRGGTASV